jgi:hypothetical protein
LSPASLDKSPDKSEKRNPVRFFQRILSQVQALKTKLARPGLKKVLIALDQNFRIVEN